VAPFLLGSKKWETISKFLKLVLWGLNGTHTYTGCGKNIDLNDFSTRCFYLYFVVHNVDDNALFVTMPTLQI
jgi:hypothetical protein